MPVAQISVHSKCHNGWPALSLVSRKEGKMDLMIWLPALFALGVFTLGLMFAFVVACENV